MAPSSKCVIRLIIQHLEEARSAVYGPKRNPSSSHPEEGPLISNYLFLTLYFRVWIDLPGHC